MTAWAGDKAEMNNMAKGIKLILTIPLMLVFVFIVAYVSFFSFLV